MTRARASSRRRAKTTRSNASSPTPALPVATVRAESQTDVWDQYALDVVAGRAAANQLVRRGCARYLRDLETGAARGLQFDRRAARRVIVFFSSFLRHSKGQWAGQSFVPDPWEQFILANIYGWKRADGTRRFRVAYIEIPKKNGKSTLCAGIGIYMLVADGEPGAEVYAFATKKDQAKIIFEEAVRMRDSSPALQKRVGHFRNNLHVRATNSKFEPISSDEDSNDGLNPSCGLGDELHRHPNNGLWNLIDFSGAARRQPLMIGITTAGIDRTSFCYNQHELARQILTGVLDNDAVFAFIANLDPELDGDWKVKWEDPGEWEKANPAFRGGSLNVEKMKDEAKEAAQQPTMLNDFLRYRLNVWTQASERAISPDQWRKCAGVELEKENARAAFERFQAELVGRRCYGGLDLADTIDMASVVFDFPKADDNPVHRVLPFFFVPEERILERSKKDRVPYDVWRDMGFLFATPGNSIDYNFIRAFIQQFDRRYKVLEIGFDRWNATQLVTQLDEEDGLTMVRIEQTFLGLSAATKEMLRMIAALEFAHGNHPVLTWQADNLVTTRDPAGNLKPDRKRAREKIDGMVSWIMATARRMAHAKLPAVGPPRITRL